jgi:hypothetical protein
MKNRDGVSVVSSNEIARTPLKVIRAGRSAQSQLDSNPVERKLSRGERREIGLDGRETAEGNSHGMARAVATGFESG